MLKSCSQGKSGIVGDDRRKVAGGLKIKLMYSRQNPKVRRRGDLSSQKTKRPVSEMEE